MKQFDSIQWAQSVPRINESTFVDRTHQTQDIKEYLYSYFSLDSNSSMMAITGPIGSGKSMVAFAYENYYKKEYKTNSCCIDLRDVVSPIPDHLKKQFDHWLKQHTDEISLVVLDNIIDERVIKELLIDKHGYDKLHVIITTVNYTPTSSELNIDKISIGMFSPKEARSLIYKHKVNLSKVTELDKALQEIEYIPLLVRQLGIQIRNQQDGIHHSLLTEELITHNLPQKEFCELSLSTRMQKLLEFLKVKYSPAFYAVLSSQYNSTPCINTQIFGKSTSEVLNAFGMVLIKKNNSFISPILKKTVNVLVKNGFSPHKQQVYEQTLDFLYGFTTPLFDGEEFNFHHSFSVENFLDIETHFKDFLLENITVHKSDVSNKKAILYLRISYIYYCKDKFAEALQFNDLAIECVIKVPTRTLEIGYFQLVKALILIKKNEIATAETLLKKIINYKQSTYIPLITTSKKDDYGPHSAMVVAIANSCLSKLYLKTNRLNEAKITIELAITEKTKLSDKIELAISQFVYADYLSRVGDYCTASNSYKDAYQNLKAGHLNKYLQSIQSNTLEPLILSHWGNCLRIMGRIRDAETHISEAKKCIVTLFKNSPQHPYAIISDVMLAKLFFTQYKLPDAEAILEKTLEIATLASDVKVEVLYYLGRIYIEQAHYEKARNVLREAIKIWQNIADYLSVEPVPDTVCKKISEYIGIENYKRIIHADYAKILHDLGLNFYKFGNYEIAQILFHEKILINVRELKLDITYIDEKNYKEILTAFRKHEKVRFASTFRKLANVYFRCHHYSKAIYLLEELLSLQKEIYEKYKVITNNRDIKKTKRCLARVYLATLNYGAAEDLLKQEKTDENPVDVIDISLLYLKASLYYRKGKCHKGLKILHKAFTYYNDLVKTVKIQEKSPAIVCMLLLESRFYLELGQPKQALEKAQKAEKIHSQFLLKQHPDCILLYRTLADIHLFNYNFVEAQEYYFMAKRLLSTLYNNDPNNSEQYCLQFHLCYFLYQLGEQAFYTHLPLTAHRYYSNAVDAIISYDSNVTYQTIDPDCKVLANDTDVIGLHLILMRIYMRLAQLKKDNKLADKAYEQLKVANELIAKSNALLPVGWLYVIDDLLPYETAFSFSVKLKDAFLQFLRKIINKYQTELNKQKRCLTLARLQIKVGLVLKSYEDSGNQKEALKFLSDALAILNQLPSDQSNQYLTPYIKIIVAHLNWVLLRQTCNTNDILLARKQLFNAAQNNILYHRLLREVDELLPDLKINIRFLGLVKNRTFSFLESLSQKKLTQIPIAENLYGRQEEHDFLNNFLSGTNKKICHIVGKPGTGKTQLAAKVCHDRSRYQKVLWIKADNKNSFYTAIRDWARQLGLEIEYSGDEEVMSMLRAKIATSSSNNEFLFVFDSVYSLRELSPNLHDLFPEQTHCKILILYDDSIKQDDSTPYEFQPLNELDQQEIIRLSREDPKWKEDSKKEIIKLNPKNSLSDFNMLLEWVGFHPLSINLIRGNFRLPNILTRFYQFAKNNAVDLKMYSSNNLEILLSFILSEVLEPWKTAFIDTLVYLRCDELSQVLLEDIFQEFQAAVLPSQDKLQEIFDDLVQLGLLQIIDKNKYYSMHLLLQKAIQILIQRDPERFAGAYGRTINVINKHFKFDRRNPSTFSEMNEYWLHGLELLKFSDNPLSTGFCSILSKIRLTIGEYFLYYLRDAQGAITFFKNNDNMKETSPDAQLRIANLLSYAHYVRGEYQVAEEEQGKVMRLLTILEEKYAHDGQWKKFLWEEKGMSEFMSAKILYAASRRYKDAAEKYLTLLNKINAIKDIDTTNYSVDKGLLQHEIGKAYLAIAKKCQDEADPQAENFFAEAINAFNKALDYYAERPDKLYYSFTIRTVLAKCLTLIAKGDTEGANATLHDKDIYSKTNSSENMPLDINGAQLCLIKALINFEKNQFDAAEKNVKTAIKLKKKYKESEYDIDGLIESYRLLSKIYLTKGYFKKAFEKFKKAKQIVSERFDAYQAEDDKRLLLDLHRQSMVSLLLLVEANSNAKVEVQNEISYYAGDATGNTRHQLYVKLYRFNFAILDKSTDISAILTELKSFDFNQEKESLLKMLYFQTLGNAYYRKAFYKEAIEAFTTASEETASLPFRQKIYTALHNRMIANCHYKMGQWELAFDAFDKTLTIQNSAYIKHNVYTQPKFFETLVLLARLLLRCNTQKSTEYVIKLLCCTKMFIKEHEDLKGCEKNFQGTLDLDELFQQANFQYKQFSNSDYVPTHLTASLFLKQLLTEFKKEKSKFRQLLQNPPQKLRSSRNNALTNKGRSISQGSEGLIKSSEGMIKSLRSRFLSTPPSYATVANQLTTSSNIGTAASTKEKASESVLTQQTRMSEISMRDKATLSIENSNTQAKFSGTASAVSKLISNPISKDWKDVLQGKPSNDQQSPQPSRLDMSGKSDAKKQNSRVGFHFDLRNSTERTSPAESVPENQNNI